MASFQKAQNYAANLSLWWKDLTHCAFCVYAHWLINLRRSLTYVTEMLNGWMISWFPFQYIDFFKKNLIIRVVIRLLRNKSIRVWIDTSLCFLSIKTLQIYASPGRKRNKINPISVLMWNIWYFQSPLYCIFNHVILQLDLRDYYYISHTHALFSLQTGCISFPISVYFILFFASLLSFYSTLEFWKPTLR